MSLAFALYAADLCSMEKIPPLTVELQSVGSVRIVVRLGERFIGRNLITTQMCGWAMDARYRRENLKGG